MPHLISTYFGTSWLLGLSALVGLTLVFGPLYGAYGAWVSWLAGRGAANPLLAAAGLGLVEWARTSAGSIFGWALLAHTQTPGASVLQTADLGGAYLPGAILAATAFVIAWWLSTALAGRRRVGWTIALVVAVAAAFAYATFRTSQTSDQGEAFRVGVVQGGIPHEDRWQPDSVAEDLLHYLEMTEDAGESEPALVVWPEYAISFDLRRRSYERTALFEATIDGRPPLLLGAPYHRGLAPPVLQNSAFLLRDGAIAGRYDKNELLPFAERNPWPGLVALERDQYTPGRRARPIRTDDVELGVFLCSEGLRPDVARRLTANGATVLVNLSNDSWLGRESAAEIQLRGAALRAIENRRHIVRATGSGLSALIDPSGRVLARATFGEPDVLSGVVEPRAEETLYTRSGDLVVALFAIAVVLGSVLAFRRPAPSTAVQR